MLLHLLCVCLFYCYIIAQSHCATAKVLHTEYSHIFDGVGVSTLAVHVVDVGVSAVVGVGVGVGILCTRSNPTNAASKFGASVPHTLQTSACAPDSGFIAVDKLAHAARPFTLCRPVLFNCSSVQLSSSPEFTDESISR